MPSLVGVCRRQSFQGFECRKSWRQGCRRRLRRCDALRDTLSVGGWLSLLGGIGEGSVGGNEMAILKVGEEQSEMLALYVLEVVPNV